ncbi:MAG: oligosaccharide repeat unit polymerase [Prevotella sp.]|nr:oligosaccharide repeat unit polymerase [Prevotella sp.]
MSVLNVCKQVARKCKRLLRQRYVTIVLALTAIGLLLSYCIPDEYAAQAKISDEYKTTDLLIGLNSINVMMRDLNVDAGNEGTDDIEIYAKFLTSEDFIGEVSRIAITKYGTDYQHYLADHYRRPFWEMPFHWLSTRKETQEESVREIIRDHIHYNISLRSQTVELQVTSQDAEVAAIVLQEALTILRQGIEQFRTQRAKTEQANALARRKAAREAYREAKQRYDSFADANKTPSSDYVASLLDELMKDYTSKYDLYRKAAEAYTRADYLVKKENTSFFVVKQYNLSQTPLSPHHWAYALVAALAALFGCVCHARIKRKGIGNVLRTFDFGDWFSPWSITLLIWTMVLGLYYLLDTELYPLRSQFYYCFFIWITVFCICSLLAYNLSEDRRASLPASGQAGGSPIEGDFPFNKPLFTFFFVISLIITPLYVYQVLQIVMMFSTEDLMNNARILAIYGEGQGFLNYSNVINQSLLVVALWAHPRVPMWQVVVLVLACLLNSLAIMEKGGIFFVFFCVAFVLFEKRIIRIRSIAIAGMLLIGFFYLFNLARSGEDSDYQQNETLLDFFAMYALASPVAFGQLMQDVTPQFGANTFETIYLFLNRFGVSDIIVKQKLQDFAWVPIPTNVYTIFHPFFVDFGYKGIAFFSAFYGVVTGWLYRLLRNGSSIGCCLYTYAAEVLVLQFYQENVFFSMVYVIQFSVFIILFAQQRVGLQLNLSRA